jgi:hypothetical protein
MPKIVAAITNGLEDFVSLEVRSATGDEVITVGNTLKSHALKGLIPGRDTQPLPHLLGRRPLLARIVGT